MRLQRAILTELTGTLLLIGTGIAFASVVGVVVGASFRARGASLFETLELVPHMGSGLVPYLVPLVFLIAVIQTYGRLSVEREIIAIRMAGLHFARLLTPALLVGAVLSIGIFSFSSEIEPALRRRQTELLKKLAAAVLQPSDKGINEISFIKEGRGGKPDLGFYMSWAERDEEGSFRDLFLSYSNESDERQLHARRANLWIERAASGDQVVALQVFDPTFIGESSIDRSGGTLRFPLEIPIRVRNVFATTAELYAHAATFEREPLPKGDSPAEKKARKRTKRRRAKLLYEIHSRTAQSLAPLVFALVGVPISMLIRSRARLVTFGVAIGIAMIGFYPMSYVGNGLAREEAISPILGAYAPVLVFAIAGMELLRRACRL